jgi:hypothetical protein
VDGAVTSVLIDGEAAANLAFASVADDVPYEPVCVPLALDGATLHLGASGVAGHEHENFVGAILAVGVTTFAAPPGYKPRTRLLPVVQLLRRQLAEARDTIEAQNATIASLNAPSYPSLLQSQLDSLISVVHPAANGDVVLGGANGTAKARSLLSLSSSGMSSVEVSSRGVNFNATTLNEAVLSSLATLVQAQTTLVQTQTSSLQEINAVFTVQTNALTLQNMANNLTQQLAVQQAMAQEVRALVNSTLSAVLDSVTATILAVETNVTAALVAQQADVSSVIVANTALVNSTAALQTQLLAPLTCDEPGGDRLRFSHGTWKCVCAVGWSGSSCDVPPSPPPPSPPPSPPAALYDTTIPIILTSCGVTGRTGPTLTQCQSTYSSPSSFQGGRLPYSWVYSPSIFSFGYPPTAVTPTAVWQRLVVPQGGVYNITAAGGAGGGVAFYSDRFRGASISHPSIHLDFGAVLYVMVGQRAATRSNQHNGGGGGTFVLNGNGSALLIAGGGGGSNYYTSGSPGDGDASLTSTSGKTASGGGGGSPGGTDGSGGTRNPGGSMGYGGAGGGLASDGQGGGGPGLAALNGGTDGVGSDNYEGGFGGGGQLGGGGGYSGGGGIVEGGSNTAGGGGGSFCLGGFSNCATSYNVGDGWVSIAYVHG